MIERRGCPFCREQVKILITDDEGNVRDEIYLDNPFSGLWFVLSHPDYNNDCPLTCHEDEPLGIMRYDTPGEAYTAWNTCAYDAEMEGLRAEIAKLDAENTSLQQSHLDAYCRAKDAEANLAELRERFDTTVDRYERHIVRRVEDTADSLDKLAAYEDAEEQGLLVRVPCKRGDAVWFIFGFYSKAVKKSVVSYCKYDGADWIIEADGRSLVWGQRAFATRAEVEAALEKEGNDVLPR